MPLELSARIRDRYKGLIPNEAATWKEPEALKLRCKDFRTQDPAYRAGRPEDIVRLFLGCLYHVKQLFELAARLKLVSWTETSTIDT